MDAKLQSDLAEAIGSKKAMVKFTEDRLHPHLEVTVEGSQYTRIMFDPADHPGAPYVLYAYDSKDDFYDDNLENMWSASYTKEALQKIVEDTDYFYGRYNHHPQQTP